VGPQSAGKPGEPRGSQATRNRRSRPISHSSPPVAENASIGLRTASPVRGSRVRIPPSCHQPALSRRLADEGAGCWRALGRIGPQSAESSARRPSDPAHPPRPPGFKPPLAHVTVYVVTSLALGTASPAQLAGWLRGHWRIENRLRVAHSQKKWVTSRHRAVASPTQQRRGRHSLGQCDLGDRRRRTIQGHHVLRPPPGTATGAAKPLSIASEDRAH
jgi:hypothetical protein